MFVHRTRGVVASTLSALAFVAACSDPKQRTDLRPEGPPEVLTVMVANDAANGLLEAATYCALNDPFRPGLVGTPDGAVHQICEEDLSKPAPEVTDAAPDGWYVRIMFDELLNPDIEEVTEVLDANKQPTGTFVGSIKNTKPVKLECKNAAGTFVNVAYDGYYSPSGNKVTWPLGPSLVIIPSRDPVIPTNTDCQVTINTNVVDRDNNQVPAAERGPFKFRTAAIQVLSISPADKEIIPALQVVNDNIYVQFNTEVDPKSFCDQVGAGTGTCSLDGGACDPALNTMTGNVGCTDPTDTCLSKCNEFAFNPDIGFCLKDNKPCEVQKNGADCATANDKCVSGGNYAYSLAPFGLTPAEFGFGPTLPVQVDKSYTFSFLQGGMIKDRCGVVTTFGAPSVADNTLVHYTTLPFGPGKLNLAPGDVVAPLKKPNLPFTNVLDLSSLKTNEFSITPSPTIPPTATVCTMAAQCTAGAGGDCVAGKCLYRLTTTSGGDFLFRGFYQLNTEYKLTINAGATISDVYGVVYTNPAAISVMWKTQPAILLTAVSPKDQATSVKATPTSKTSIKLSFNQAMVPTSLDANVADGHVKLTGSAGTIPLGPATTLDCTSASKTTCGLTLATVSALAPGAYVFTIKQGTVITDQLGNVYTQAADKVVNFIVKEAPPKKPVRCL